MPASENQSRTIIHIGIPRAASTYFQKQVFPNIADFEAFGPEITEYYPAFRQLLYSEEELFDQSKLHEFNSKNGVPSIILSNELFCGKSHGLASANREQIAQRLKLIWPDAELLIILRNQVDLLQSLYTIDTYSGMSVSPEAYVDFSKVRPESSFEWAGSWDFDKLVHLYSSLFRKVNVYLFEDFAADRNVFLDQLQGDFRWQLAAETISPSRVNSSLGKRQVAALRSWNRWKSIAEKSNLGSRIFRKGSQIIEHRWPSGAGFQFSAEFQNQISDRFRESNERLLALRPELAQSETFKAKYALP